MNAELLLWLSLALATYTFAGYPLLAIILARLRPHATAPAITDATATPSLTVVIAAHDEADRIDARVRNLLDCDWPAERLRIVVADDGSSDGTADVVRAISDSRVRVVRLAEPRGKAAALTAAMAGVDSELTVFADARQQFDRGALRALAAPFSDGTVGAVAGELVLVQARGNGHAVATDGAYWKIERALREAEARLGWAHGVSGAVYAIRTPLFRPLPDGLVLDDMYTPLQIVRQGYVIRHARDAIAYDHAATALDHEFRRKLRTLAGNWQLIVQLPWLLDPRANPVFFAWLSHKLARLVAPWALLAALLTAAAAPGPLARIAFWAQLAAYALALVAILFPRLTRRIPLASTAGSFVTLNTAALLSLPLFLRHRDLARMWKRQAP